MCTGLRGEGDLLLRPARASDSPRWLELLADPAYVTYASPAFVVLATGAEELAPQVERSQAAWAAREPGQLVVATGAAPDVLLGEIAWRWTAVEALGVAELGYGVHPAARGRGVAQRALRLLAGWLLDPAGRGLARVQLDHSVENPASCGVARGAGFAQEGVRRGFLPLREPGGGVRRHDVCLHGLLLTPSAQPPAARA